MGKKTAPYVPPPPVDYAAESKARQKEQNEMDVKLAEERGKLLSKKQTGQYASLLTGGEGVQDEAKVKQASLLGSGRGGNT